MANPARPGPSSDTSYERLRRIFWLADAGIVLYLVLDVVAQLLPPHYSPVSTAESDLAVGPYGYVMTLNFVNRGLLSLAFLYAFVRTTRLQGVNPGKYRSGILLLGVWAVGALLLAPFPTDVPATPVSWHGYIHLTVALLAFLGGALGCAPSLPHVRRRPHDGGCPQVRAAGGGGRRLVPGAALRVAGRLPASRSTNRWRHRESAHRFDSGLDPGRLAPSREKPKTDCSGLTGRGAAPPRRGAASVPGVC